MVEKNKRSQIVLVTVLKFAMPTLLRLKSRVLVTVRGEEKRETEVEGTGWSEEGGDGGWKEVETKKMRKRAGEDDGGGRRRNVTRRQREEEKRNVEGNARNEGIAKWSAARFDARPLFSFSPSLFLPFSLSLCLFLSLFLSSVRCS